jgi:xyloglucan-specific exo-beta-1,4-glucanase
MKNKSSTLRTILSRAATVLVLPLIGIAAALVYRSNVAPDPALAQTTETYTWRNVAIGGGGGFVPGIVFNTTEQNLIYARTDIGGAYRWDQVSGRWIPLLDWIGFDDWNLTGVDSIATDPVDPTRLYIAAGTYTNEWTSQNGAILRSTNRGNSFLRTNLPFKVGGNMPGRSMGERLAIDPNRNSILYFGARSGNGLWRSTNFGESWSRVTSFPVAGTYVEDPSNSYTGDIVGVVWVTFDRRTGTPGNTTQTIYVGVADKGNSVYRSTDGGATWAAVPGQPTGFLPHHGVLASNGMLYITYSDGAGPYDGEKGDVWRYDTSSGSWTMISPVPSSSSDNYFGYGGLTVDAQNPNIVMVASLNSWWPDTILFRSLNGGATWTRIWDWTSYPNRSFRYLQNITAAPWLNFNANPQLPELTPKLGWMTGDLEIDPFNSNRMMYGTGATIYGSDNLTTWDTGGQITISVKAQGLEETAVLDLISPPSGAPLLSGVGDICGFRHNSLTTPTTMMGSPTFVSTTSLDYAELSPTFIVRVGNANAGTNRSGFSFDGGTSWFQGSTEPGGVTGGGTVAAAANATRVVWSPAGAQVNVSTNNGSSWTQSQGIPSGARVGSDRVNPMKFYGVANGTFYVSVNGGANFTAAATGLPTDSKFKAVPGREGDIWLAGAEGGLWRSTNSGASFTRVTSVEEADTIGFGMAAPGQSYMALYSSAQVNGVRGIFRSTDTGATWVRINDDQRQYGSTSAAITGDPRVFGRVYVSTNGRGIIYGEPSGVSNPDFSISPNPTSLTINRGASGTITIPVTRTGGFTSQISLSASGLPSGCTASFNPNPVTGSSSVLTLTCSSTATLGAATGAITATGGGLTRTSTINLTVTQPPTPDFSLAASPTSLTVNRGASGASTITITRTGGFTGSVAFSASGLPSGVTAGFNPTSTTENSATLTLAASSTATLGAATVTVTGTSGSLARTTTISLTVAQPPTPDFSLAANPTSLTVNRGASGTSTITITRTGGFTGAVALSASGLPSGVSASFNPASATGTSSVLTLTASGTATLGAATVTVTGTGGSLTRTASINLTVNDSGGGTGGVTVTPVVSSNGPWFNEQAISLNNTGAITSLSITIVVQRTTGVSSSGQYNTVGGQILQSNSSTATTITYQFNLAAGQTLGSATNRLFAAQMSGSGTVHPTTGDTYTVTYTTGGVSFTQTGHF